MICNIWLLIPANCLPSLDHNHSIAAGCGFSFYSVVVVSYFAVKFDNINDRFLWNHVLQSSYLRWGTDTYHQDRSREWVANSRVIKFWRMRAAGGGGSAGAADTIARVIVPDRRQLRYPNELILRTRLTICEWNCCVYSKLPPLNQLFNNKRKTVSFLGNEKLLTSTQTSKSKRLETSEVTPRDCYNVEELVPKDISRNVDRRTKGLDVTWPSNGTRNLSRSIHLLLLVLNKTFLKMPSERACWHSSFRCSILYICLWNVMTVVQIRNTNVCVVHNALSDARDGCACDVALGSPLCN